jgi:hypothetical protein
MVFFHILVPSGPPRNITVWAVSPTSIQVSWLPPPEEDQNGRIIGYKLLLNSTSAPDRILEKTYIIQDSENLTMLIPGKARSSQQLQTVVYTYQKCKFQLIPKMIYRFRRVS